jgi:hypothetical protein
METAHRFETPHVTPMATVREEAPECVLFRVSPAEAERILRAVEETSSHLAHAPSGARVAATYRRLAATLRVQASGAYEPAPRVVRHAG